MEKASARPKLIDRVLILARCYVVTTLSYHETHRIKDRDSMTTDSLVQTLADCQRRHTVELGIRTFQTKLRQRQSSRREIRLLEFYHWYETCRRHRAVLTDIVICFLVIVGSFTLVLSTLFSAAFSDH